MGKKKKNQYGWMSSYYTKEYLRKKNKGGGKR